MPFATPLALLGLLFVPAVIAMYLLKLRRDEAVVPSTLLWTRLVADVEANAPWQKLRRSLLLLLQILLVIILAALAARPFLERPAGLARDIVLVVDTSASMGATDVVPDRLSAAKAAAIDALRELPTGRQGQRHRRRPRGAHRGQRVDRPGPGPRRHRGHHRHGQPGRPRRRPGARLQARRPVRRRAGPRRHRRRAGRRRRPAGSAPRSRSCRSGATARTRPSSRWPSDRRPSGVARSVFVSVANLDLEPAARRVELWSGDRLLEVRDVMLEPQARADVIVDDLDPARDQPRGPARGHGPGGDHAGRPAGRRRPRLGGHPRAATPARPRRRRGRPLSRDRARLAARRRAVRRHAGRVRPGHANARTAGRGTSSSSRASSRRPCRARRSWPSPRRAPARSAR